MKDRILRIIRAVSITKSEFAKSLNISPALVSMMCTGEKIPTARTKADICRIYSVNPVWLETGEGDPFTEKSLGEELGVIAKNAGLVDPEAAAEFFHKMIDGMTPAQLVLLYTLYKERYDR